MQEDPNVEPDPQPEPEPPKQTVPLAELIEERHKRQASEQEFKEFKETVDERLARLSEAPAPDLEDDPFGKLEHSQEKLSTDVSDIKKTLEDQQKQNKEAVESQQFNQTVANLESQFKAKTPDYDSAVQHLSDTWMKQYQSMGMSNEDAMKRLNEDAQRLMNNAMAAGKNPAEVAYEMSQGIGYKAGSKGGTKKLNDIAKGMKNQTLSDTGGGSETDMDSSTLAAMSDDDFNDYLDKNPGAFKKIMNA